jgi:hypothetical protein
MSQALPAPVDSSRPLRRWMLVFLSFGILWRLTKYALGMPIWMDEASVGLNIVSRSYADLLKPLDWTQVAPIGFLWAERAAAGAMGMGEYSMRLFPAIAGLATLPLFAIWVRLLARPAVCVVAVAILAVSIFSAGYAVELKPYGIDLCFALLLLLPATLYLLRGHWRYLVYLIALTPIALVLSYTAVFLAGGIAIALLFSLRRPRPAGVALIATFGLVLAASFLLLVYPIANGQYSQTAVPMDKFWHDAFPPANPLKFAWWFIRIHTGRMFAYPIGDRNGGSVVSATLFFIGLFAWIRSRQAPLVALLLAPFVLTLVAAAVQRYPYGNGIRLTQHLAPAIILLIAVGAIAAIEHLSKTATAQVQSFHLLLAGLLVIGFCGVARDLIHPYHTPGEWQTRAFIRNTFAQAAPQTTFAILASPECYDPTLRWYVLEGGRPTVWYADSDHSWQKAAGPICVLSFDRSVHPEHDISRQLGRSPTSHTAVELTMPNKEDAIIRLECFSYPPPAAIAARPGAAASAN